MRRDLGDQAKKDAEKKLGELRTHRKKKEADDKYVQTLREKNDKLMEEFIKKWQIYAREKRLHEIESQEYNLERMGHELKTALARMDWDSWPEVQDEIDLFIPLKDDLQGKLAMKTSN